MSPSRGGQRRVAAIIDALQAHLPDMGALRVPAAARPAHLAARRAAIPPSHPMVIVARSDDEAHRLADDLAAWLAWDTVHVLAERAALPLERALPEHEESAARLEVLSILGSRLQHSVVVASLPALVQRTLSPQQLADGRIELRLGERIGQRTLLERLVAAGFEPSVEVTGIGEFAHRGGIVDLWPPAAADPVRVELFGDEIESIRTFDPMSQASRRRIEHVTLLPASEFAPPGGWDSLAAAVEPSTELTRADLVRLEHGDLREAAETWAAHLTAGPAVDHLPPTTHLVLTDPGELRALARDLDEQATVRRDGLAAIGDLPADWALPYDAAAALRSLEANATEKLDE